MINNNLGIAYSNDKSQIYKIRESCKSMGYELIYASSCEEILKLIKEYNCSFVLLDVSDPLVIMEIIDGLNGISGHSVIIINENISKDFKFIGRNVFAISYADLMSVIKLIDLSKKENVKDNYIEQNKDMFMAVTEVLYQIGIPINMSGFDYLRYAVVEYEKIGEGTINIRKDIYQMVADRFNKTPSCIEKGIRTCIAKANQDKKLSKIIDVLGIVKLSNSVIISYVADKVKMNSFN